MTPEPVKRYLAIRPIERGPETGLRGGDDGLEAMRADLRASATRLAGVGLQFVPRLADIPADPAIGGYVTLPQFNALVLEPPAGTDVDALRERLADDYVLVPNFTLSLPDAGLGVSVAEADVVPVGDAVPEISGVQHAHEQGNRGEGVVVAVLDSGCDAGHREFANRKVTFVSVPADVSVPENRVFGFDTATHGTHVTGTVAGATVGIAPGVELIHAAVLDNEAYTTTALRVIKALNWLIDELKEDRYQGKTVLLSMSLGFNPSDVPEDEVTSVDANLRAMRIIMQQLIVSRRILPIVAIGNSGPNTACAPGFFPECLAVGAIDYTSASWPCSSGGSGAPGFEQEANPDIAGFGVDVVSAIPRDADGASRWEKKSGTSMATPYVTAIAALVAAKTELQGAELRKHLLDNALDLGLDAERVGKGLARYVV